RLFLCFLALFPSENLVNLREDEERSFLIELRRHRRCTSTQVRQTHQDSGLPAGESGRHRLIAVYAGRVRRKDTCCRGSAESGCRYGAETARTQCAELY